MGSTGTVAVGDRVWAETTLTGLDPESLDSGTETGRLPMPEGTSVIFDFGGVVDGYCSDFGRTVVAGEPSQALLDAYTVMLAATRGPSRLHAGRARL